MDWKKRLLIALALVPVAFVLFVVFAWTVLLPRSLEERDRTALHTAAEHNDVAGIRQWLADGGAVDPEMQSKSTLEHSGDKGVTPLMLAARSGSADAALLLLEAGARPDARSYPPSFPEHGTTVLEHAVEGGHPAIVKAIAARLPRDLPQHQQDRLAGRAIRTVCEGDSVDGGSMAPEAAAVILDEVVSSELGRARLENAVATPRCTRVVALALDRGIRATLPMLVLAADAGDVTLVQRLLAAGADANAPASKPYQDRPIAPLHAAFQAQHTSTVHALLEGGADPNVLNADGATLLHVTVRMQHNADIDLINRLIAAGARVDIPDRDGKTARELAQSSFPGRMDFPFTPAARKALQIPAFQAPTAQQLGLPGGAAAACQTCPVEPAKKD